MNLISYYLLSGKQAEDAMSRGKSLLNLQEEWRNLLIDQKASRTPHRLSDLLFEIPVITIPQA